MKKKSDFSRRGFLQSAFAGAAGLSAARTASAEETPPPPQQQQQGTPPKADYLRELDRANEVELPTDDNIEGPFYRPGAPFRSRFRKDEDQGDILVVSGTVVARNGRPLEGAIIDLWHASQLGAYDNEDPLHPPPNDEYRFRGRLKTNERGEYSFETIRPGNYKIGPVQYRAAHIHLKIACEGYKGITTQLFFKGDPHSRLDPWFKPSMVLDARREDDRYVATFKFVLAKGDA